jgi:hypothetical protein
MVAATRFSVVTVRFIGFWPLWPSQQLLAEFWIPADWLPYSPDLNPLDIAIWRVLQATSQVTPYAILDLLCLSIAAE